MQKATVYLNHPIAPGGKDWDAVYEIIRHDATGLRFYDGMRHQRFYPAHEIQRIDYK